MYGVPNDGLSVTGGEWGSVVVARSSSPKEPASPSGNEVEAAGTGIEPKHLVIKVLTFNRPASLRRLMASLDKVDYRGDPADLEFWVDGVRGGRSTADRDAVGVCLSLKIMRRHRGLTCTRCGGRMQVPTIDAGYG